MQIKSKIIDNDGLNRIITRIAHEILERNKGYAELNLNGNENQRGVSGKSNILKD